MKKILVVIPVNDRHKAFLEQQTEGTGEDNGFEFIYKPGAEVTEEDVADVRAVIGNLSPAMIRKAKNLEWFQTNSAGYDQYLHDVLPEGAALTPAVGAYGLSVSEHMLGQTFALIRHLPMYRDAQRENRWIRGTNIISVEGSVIAVLGTGDIGGDYARKVKALGAYTIGVRKHNKPKPEYLDEQVLLSSLDEVLPRADIVAMVLPGSPETEGLMNEARLRKMKPGAYLLNVGRGSAVDLPALKKVLDEGLLAGAALDVTNPEPLPADDSLWQYENVFITPHVAGDFWLAETFERIVRIAGKNLHAWSRGEKLPSVL